MASQVMWKVVKPWIHPITRSKIELVGSRYEETFRAQGIVLTSGGTEVGPLLGPLLGPHARTLRSTQHAACSAHAHAARRAPRAARHAVHRRPAHACRWLHRGRVLLADSRVFHAELGRRDAEAAPTQEGEGVRAPRRRRSSREDLSMGI